MGKRTLKTRAVSLFLVFLMVLSLIPSQDLAYAAELLTAPLTGQPSVNVTWQPAKETIQTGETGEISLQASIEQGETGGIQSAVVRISLTAQETLALENRQNFDESGKGISDEGNGTLQLVKAEDGSSVLTATLTQETPSISKTFSVQTVNGSTLPFTLDVTQEDIQTECTLTEEAKAQGVKPKIAAQSAALAVSAAYQGWTVDLQAAESESVQTEDGVCPDFTFVMNAASQNRAETGSLYTGSLTFTWSLALPEGLAWPEGAYTCESGTILADGVPVIGFTGLPQDLQVANPTRGDAQTLTFDLVRQSGEVSQQEMEDLNLTADITGGSLLLADPAPDSEDCTVTASVHMTAASLAGESDVCEADAFAETVVRMMQPSDTEETDDTEKPAKEEEPEEKELPDVESTENSLTDGENPESQNGEEKVQVLADPAMEIIECEEAFQQTVFWIDNRNELGNRFSTDSYKQKLLESSLWFSVNGGEMKKLTSENLTEAGLNKMPEISVTEQGIGTYQVSIADDQLPTKLQYADEYGDPQPVEIQWEIRAPGSDQVDGYYFVDVIDPDAYQSVEEPGWYYLLETDYEINIHLRWGSRGDPKEIEENILDNFQFYVHTNIRDDQYSLREIIESRDGEIDWSGEPEYKGILTISGLPRYNLDGSRTTYTLNSKDSGNVFVPDFLTEEDQEAGDYMEATYDNTSVPNFSNETTQVYSGGTLYLTLKGVTDYEATKIWLDPEGTDPQNRPDAEFQLWRYRAGSSDTTAAVVRDESGEILSVRLDKTQDESVIVFGQDGEELTLPKYDPEGYRYIYVAREYLEGNNVGDYEQVFGRIERKEAADGTLSYEITDRLDQKGEVVSVTTPFDFGDDENAARGSNTFVYDDGTLSNRIHDSKEVSAEKVWKAAAFQAAFEDVDVELTLQYRPANTELEWQDTGITERMTDFIAESLSDTVSRTMEKYGPLGQELEYRWVETGVYQNNVSQDTNLFQPNADSASGGTFTLSQDGREVKYQSAAVTEDGHTQITNTIANEIDYLVDKEWYDADGKDIWTEQIGTEISFTLYQTKSGLSLTDGSAIGTFTMDGIADEEAVPLEKAGPNVTVQETSSWHAEVKNLPEFDEEGSRYEYVILESEGEWLPTYETTIDGEGNYHTKVINRPGPGQRILVSKEWIDQSDAMHREPVTINVYSKVEKDGNPVNSFINTITLGSDTNQQWYGYVGIGDYKPDEVYILETSVGNNKVPLTTWFLQDEGSGKEPNYTDPQEPKTYDGVTDTSFDAMQYSTENHNYAAVYSPARELNRETLYTVINRRLGNVDLTVTKNWKDGGDENGKREQIREELENLEAEGTTLYRHSIWISQRRKLQIISRLPDRRPEGYGYGRKSGQSGSDLRCG